MKPEALANLKAYAALLTKWNSKINLVSPDTLDDLWTRHIEDSLQLAKRIPSGNIKLLDMGSGAGLPGIVLANALPEITVTLVERDQRKCAFLREAIRALALTNIQVLNMPVEQVSGTKYEVVTARALAPLHQLCNLAFPHLGKDGICLFPKGKNFAMEIQEAEAQWSFSHVIIPSITQEDSAIVSISKLKQH